MKTHLIIHHSATADSGSLSWPVIRHNHKMLGWRDVGYHFGVERFSRNAASGQLEGYEILVGRPVFDRAAGEPNLSMNRIGVHVCFIGNYDNVEPPELMLQYAVPHLTDWCEALNIPLDRRHILGHRELNRPDKTCPGTMFDLDALVERMRGR